MNSINTLNANLCYIDLKIGCPMSQFPGTLMNSMSPGQRPT